MRAKDTNCEGSHAVRIEYTDKPVSGWGGLILAGPILRWVGVAGVAGPSGSGRAEIEQPDSGGGSSALALLYGSDWWSAVLPRGEDADG